jgi:hypothetical protein
MILRAATAALCALSLAGCVDSADPILADSQPVFGERLKLQLYTLDKGYAREPVQVTYAWNGGLYTHAGGGLREVSAFSVHPFEGGDYIIQTVSGKKALAAEYALMHKLADGVYRVNAIDEADADEQTRVAYCKRLDRAACRIATREQLFAFARATAARNKEDGGLVIRLPDGSTPRETKRRVPAVRR